MINKAIHHLHRSTLLTLEIIGVLGLMAAGAWGGLLWRLSQGPLDTGFLTERVERALNQQQSDFIIDIGSTELTWGGQRRPVELQINRVQVTRPDKTPVLSVGRIWIELSRRRLIVGQIVPRTIRIHGAALRVMRWDDGQMTLNLTEGADAPAPVDNPPGGRGVLETLLQKLQEDRIPLMGGLERVLITNAAVFYEDKALNLSSRARRTDLSFTRNRHGLTLDATALVDMGADTDPAEFAARAQYDSRKKSATTLLTFRDLNPSYLIQGAGPLEKVAKMDLPLSGSLALATGPAFAPKSARFTLSSGRGRVGLSGVYDAPMGLRALSAAGHIDLESWSGGLERLTVALGGVKGPVAAAKAIVYRGAGNARRIDISAALSGMPIDALKEWWPESLAADARGWVTQHLSAGIANRATIETSLTLDDTNAAAVEKLGGRIDFTGVKVDYLPPLPAVTGVDGVANYDLSNFTLDLKGGQMEDMTVGASKISITDLGQHTDKAHAQIDIGVSLSGPLKTALRTLDAKPLGFVRDLGVPAENVDGRASIDLGFHFPLHHALALHDIQATAKARLTDTLLPAMVAGLPLSDGPIDVAFEDKNLSVSGAARLAGTPVSFTWQRAFTPGDGPMTRVEARGAMTPALLSAFGVPNDVTITGDAIANLVYSQKFDGTGDLTLDADLRTPALSVPAVGYTKPAGAAAALSLALDTQNGVLRRVSAFRFDAPGAPRANIIGTAEFSNKRLTSAQISTLVLGNTDVAVHVSTLKNGTLSAQITGRQIDLSSLLASGDAPLPAVEKTPAGAPLSLSLRVNRALGAAGRTLENLRLQMDRNAWRRIERLELDAVAGQAPLTLRYLPARGGHTLDFRSDDAGAALSTLGFTNSIRRGRISVNAAPNPAGGPRDLSGTAILSNFTISGAPVLARLLNALSLTGILDLMNGKGIAFTKARANFAWTDRGPPQSVENHRMLTLRDGETSGGSLGLTFEGAIDERRKVYDLSGTIIPVSDLNKMLSSIPLVGEILSGGDSSIFAATYSLKGPKADPTVTVNPLAVLAPGILRKLFFQK